MNQLDDAEIVMDAEMFSKCALKIAPEHRRQVCVQRILERMCYIAGQTGMRAMDPKNVEVAMLGKDMPLYYMVYDRDAAKRNASALCFSALGREIRLLPSVTLHSGGLLMLNSHDPMKLLYEQMLRNAGIQMPWLRIKHLDVCFLCEQVKNKNRRLKMCSGCCTVAYCSRHCQKICWKHRHRGVCKRLNACRQSNR